MTVDCPGQRTYSCSVEVVLVASPGFGNWIAVTCPQAAKPPSAKMLPSSLRTTILTPVAGTFTKLMLLLLWSIEYCPLAITFPPHTASTLTTAVVPFVIQSPDKLITRAAEQASANSPAI